MEDFNQKITTSIKAISANRVFIPPVAIFAVNTTYYSPFFFYKIYQAGLDKMLKSSWTNSDIVFSLFKGFWFLFADEMA